MREASIEQAFVKGVKKAGGKAWKFVSPGRSGVPDRIVLLPGGKVIFVELKTETGALTPRQIEVHNQLRALDFDVRTLYDDDATTNDVDGVVNVGMDDLTGYVG